MGVNYNIVTMTNWLPDLANFPGPRYRAIADALAADIASNRLPVGTRLPTHAIWPYHLKVTVGTVTRAYAEAERRGLIGGEVGRGTYVKASTPVSAMDFWPQLPPPPSDIPAIVDCRSARRAAPELRRLWRRCSPACPIRRISKDCWNIRPMAGCRLTVPPERNG